MSLQSAVIRRIFQAAASRGAAYDRLCRLSGITPEEMSAADSMIEWEKAALIWEPLEKLTGDPLIGLHLGMELSDKQVGMVGFLMETSKDIDDAFGSFCRYSSLVAPMVNFGYEKGEVATVTMEQNGVWMHRYREAARQAMDFTVGSVIRCARALSGKKVIPLRVESVYEKRDVSECRRLWECEVVFGVPTNKLVFRKEDMELPVLTSDRSLYELFNAVLADKKAAIASGRTDVNLRSVLFNGFKGQIPAIEEAAAALSLTPRTLQRRLAAEGTSFRRVAAEVRGEIAAQLLKNPRIKLTEVAEILGYSDVSAFRRAARSWTKPATTPPPSVSR
jgi:AraC-like DNA-binding protein